MANKEAKNRRSAFSGIMMGIPFALGGIVCSLSLLWAYTDPAYSNDTNMILTTQLICATPLLLLGFITIATGIYAFKHPEKSLERSETRPMQDSTSTLKTPMQVDTSSQIACSVCHRTNAAYLRDLKRKDPNTYIVSNTFIGICPVCQAAYCVEHAAYDGAQDHEICPIHKVKLVMA